MSSVSGSPSNLVGITSAELNNKYYYYITKYTKKNRNLIGCSLINIVHIIPNIGFTAVPGGPIIFDIGQHVNIELLI